MTQTDRWESEGGAEPGGPPTAVPAQRETPETGTTVGRHEAGPEEIGERMKITTALIVLVLAAIGGAVVVKRLSAAGGHEAP